MKKLYNLIQVIKQHISDNRRIYEENREEIRKANRGIAIAILIIGSICFITLFIISSISLEYAPIKAQYALMSIIFILNLIWVLISKKCSLNFVYYVLNGILMLDAGYTSAYLYPGYSVVMETAFAILMPILILDRFWRIAVMEIIYVGAYLIAVVPLKIPDLQHDEIINVLFFAVVGCVIGIYFCNVRLKGMEFSRQGRIREKTDQLTNLLNRRSMYDYFIACESEKIDTYISGISIIDIDNFKMFNDTYGHLAGDKCLKQIGKCFTEYGEKHNISFYRYGGEEFVAISHERNKDLTNLNLRNLNKVIYDLNIPHEMNSQKVVTISQGLVLVDINIKCKEKEREKEGKEILLSRDGQRIETPRFQKILVNADQALYKAKEFEKNRTIVTEME